jgi:hypothetical protein
VKASSKNELNPQNLIKTVKFLVSTLFEGVIESCADILTTSYWLHVELGQNTYLKNSMSKYKMTFIF